jgi:hypothetical protein
MRSMLARSDWVASSGCLTVSEQGRRGSATIEGRTASPR